MTPLEKWIADHEKILENGWTDVDKQALALIKLFKHSLETIVNRDYDVGKVIQLEVEDICKAALAIDPDSLFLDDNLRKQNEFYTDRAREI